MKCVVVALVLLACGPLSVLCIGNPCDYTKYCKYCEAECPKCTTECQKAAVADRPPNCQYCKWCKMCPLCTGAKAVCAAGSSVFSYLAAHFENKDDPELQKPPSEEEIEERIRQAEEKKSKGAARSEL